VYLIRALPLWRQGAPTLWYAFCAAQANRALRSLRIAIFCTRLDNRCRSSGSAIISSSEAIPNFATAARGARRPRHPVGVPVMNAQVKPVNTVYILDDDVYVRQGLENLLRSMTFHVVSFASVPEFLKTE
jgi:hypothetical protein